MKRIPQPNDKDASKDASADELPMADLEKAELPDPQSLADAIKHWQEGGEAGEEESVSNRVDPWSENNGSNASRSAEASKRGNNGDAKSNGADKTAAKTPGKTPGKKAANTKRVSRNQSRRFARQRALQALYQWDVGKLELSDVLNQFKENQNLTNVDLDHFERLFRGVALSVDEIDVHLEPALDRPIADLDPIERSILRLSTCELRDCMQTPARVAINEAVELTKRFGADQGHKYVNGVIDKVAMALRKTEMQAGKKS